MSFSASSLACFNLVNFTERKKTVFDLMDPIVKEKKTRKTGLVSYSFLQQLQSAGPLVLQLAAFECLLVLSWNPSQAVWKNKKRRKDGSLLHCQRLCYFLKRRKDEFASLPKVTSILTQN